MMNTDNIERLLNIFVNHYAAVEKSVESVTDLTSLNQNSKLQDKRMIDS